jgi:hypothetical protein
MEFASVMSNVYWFCLLLGGMYVLIQFVMLLAGGIMHGVDMGGHDADVGGGGADLGHDFDAGHADTPHGAGSSGVQDAHGHVATGTSDMHIGPFSPMSIAMFLVGFGGMGLIATSLNIPPILGIQVSILQGLFALIVGIAVSWLLILSLNKFFEATSASSGYSISEVIGKPAVVDVPMNGQSIGQITYTAGYATRNDPAKPLNEEDSFKQGQNVFIAGYDDGVFLVVDVEHADSTEIREYMEKKVDV